MAATGHPGLRKERSRTEGQQLLSPQVPDNQNVKVHFKAFFLLEPNVPLGSCSKDYVEINGERWVSGEGEGGCPRPGVGPLPPTEAPAAPRYCGERPQFVVSSGSSKITVHFHSDQSYTDTGFLAEYLSYDASDRE